NDCPLSGGRYPSMASRTAAATSFGFTRTPCLPNGSRLSCGASAGGRKRLTLRDLLAGAQTSASSESRPRQLQALVRQRVHAIHVPARRVTIPATVAATK